MEPDEMLKVLDHVSELVNVHFKKIDERNHPINLGIDEAVKIVTRELMIGILKSDGKAKTALKRIIHESITSYIYSEKDHREASRRSKKK